MLALRTRISLIFSKLRLLSSPVTDEGSAHALAVSMPSLIPPSRISPPASCQLFDLVIHLNWDAVAKHAQEHPQDAAWLDDDCLFPLSSACQHDPSEKAIRALLEAYPPAATLASKNGDLPLHIACYSHANIGVLRALIEHEPSTVCATTKYGKTPLMALWDGHTRSSHEDIYPVTCEKSKLLLEAVARTQGLVSVDTGEPLCLHAAMKMECSDALLYYVLEEYKQQISQCDQRGHLPLHLAVAPGIPNRRKLWRCVFESLIAECPEAATTPDPVTGRLPLHTMASNPAYSWDTWDELDVVFQAAPRVIDERDPVTGLLPFALAAINKSSSAEVSFRLLAAQPDVLSRYNMFPCREESNSVRKRPLLASAVAFGFLAVVSSYVFSAAIQ